MVSRLQESSGTFRQPSFHALVMMIMTWINRGSVSNSIFLPSLSQLMSRLRSVSATALQRKVAVSPASTSYGCGP